jgi:tetratricopeptide (TPR) repeat protein
MAHVARAALLLERSAPRADELASAEASLRAALALEPAAGGAYVLLGRVELARDRPERARPLFDRAVELRPEPLPLYYLGLTLYRQRHLVEAITAVERGRDLIAEDRFADFRSLEIEMDHLLAHAHARLAEAEGSAIELVKARRYLAAVADASPGDERVGPLRAALEWLASLLGVGPFGDAGLDADLAAPAVRP